MGVKKTVFTLYKIYSENCLLYIGRTKQPLQTRLHSHFFKKPMVREINIEAVTKIEAASFPTEADMYLYEIYYINKFKPPLNRDDKARDELTISLPEVQFQEFHCPLMKVWREKIRDTDAQYEENRRLKNELEMEKNDKHKEIFSREDISTEEKQALWCDWLESVYEPIRNELSSFFEY